MEWKKDPNNHIKIFCNIESNIPPGEYYILFNKTGSFNYHDQYQVNFKDCNQAKFTKVDKNIIDLYGGPKLLLINNTIDSYDLEFNIVSYNQEVLFLNYDISLENCRMEKKILKCTITKSDFCTYFTPSMKEILLFYRNENNEPIELPLIPRIEVIIKEFPKKDIFIGITKLLVNVSEPAAPIAYETNVTDISQVYIKEKANFELIFSNKNDDNETEKNVQCHFFKYEIDPLYLICWLNHKGESHLKEIKEEIIINKTNIQYNFRIQPVKNDESIIYIGEGTSILWSYPRVLDFTKNSGPFYIGYETKYSPTLLNTLTFNENEQDLKCKNISVGLKCEVPKSHFNGEKNGYYYLKHTNTLGKRVIPYEISPIKVILEDKKGKGSSISLSIYYLVLLILAFIWVKTYQKSRVYLDIFYKNILFKIKKYQLKLNSK